MLAHSVVPYAVAMRICMVYDCLYPHTVGGAERWYRHLAQRLAADGHEVTYLTLRQWDRGADPDLPGVAVVVVGPRLGLYTESGRRKIVPPLVFGVGVLGHLLFRRRRYDTVHTASFPYFSLLAAALIRPFARYRLVVDWHEVWTLRYWREYLGVWAGTAGWLIQRLCVRIPQHAFCFSRLHAGRVQQEGLRGEVTVLEGEYTGPLQRGTRRPAEPLVVFAGRFIPEKRPETIIPAVARARATLPDLHAELLGDGPERERVMALVREAGMSELVSVPGFVSAAELDETFARALCMILPSTREGYGMVVVEAASHGTPSVVVAAPDNAAVELIAEGVNGVVAASASPEDLSDAILRIHAGGSELRDTTAEWFAANARRLSLSASVDVVARAYTGA